MDITFSPHPKDHRFKDITGQKFGRLTVLGLADYHANLFRWYCRCDCGNLKVTSGKHLKNGHSVSCGCRRTKHGHAPDAFHHSPEYTSWQGIKQRCLNTNDRRYARYGGRGITICDQWLNSFATFLADMGTKPSPRHQIDRIDNDGNYEPQNCRWATNLENNAHTSRSIQITYNGETHCLSEWARRVDIDLGTLRYRIRIGWPLDKAFGKRPPTRGQK